MFETRFRNAEREAGQRVAAALALPLPDSEHMIGVEGFFDPWDLFPNLYGSYDGDFDKMAIEVLSDLLGGTHNRTDLAAYMLREMLCKASLCDYGSSPRVCFPSQEFRELLPKLIEKWRAYSLINWGEDVTIDDDEV